MTGATIGTMLDSARQYEILLEQFLAKTRDSALNDNTRLLTYYLARLKRNLPKTFELFTDAQIAQMRAIPLKIINSEFDASRCFDNRHHSADITASELLEMTIELVDILVCFYEWLIDQPISGAARGLLEKLIQTEERSLENLKEIQGKQLFS